MYNNLPACTTKPLFFTTWYRFKIDAPFFAGFTAYHIIPCLWHLTGTKHFYSMPTGSASLLAYSQWSVGRTIVSPVQSSSTGVLSSLSGQTWWWLDHLLEKHGMHRPLQNTAIFCVMLLLDVWHIYHQLRVNSFAMVLISTAAVASHAPIHSQAG